MLPCLPSTSQRATGTGQGSPVRPPLPKRPHPFGRTPSQGLSPKHHIDSCRLSSGAPLFWAGVDSPASHTYGFSIASGVAPTSPGGTNFPAKGALLQTRNPDGASHADRVGPTIVGHERFNSSGPGSILVEGLGCQCPSVMEQERFLEPVT